MYDYVLFVAILYMVFGSDLTYNYLAGGAFGKRISANSKNVVYRYYHKIHANIDPNMRADEPVLGYRHMLPAWTIGLCSTNAILTIGVGIILIAAFLFRFANRTPGEVSNLVRFASSAYIVRSIIEIIYGFELKNNPINDKADYPRQTFAGIKLAWRSRYNIIAFIPQVYIPFLIAERFYKGTWNYSLDIIQLIIFMAIPTIICIWASFVVKKNNRIKPVEQNNG